MTVQKLNQAIGLLGGTFNPIHYGHLRPAAQILQQFNLAQIRLLPSHKPPHKGEPAINSQQRAAMVKIGCQGFSKFCVDLIELERNEPSYTVVTLQHIKQQHPNTPICFLMGMDSLLAFKSWHQWQQILKSCHLIVSCRPGWTLNASADIADVLRQHQSTDISLLQQRQAGLIYLAQIAPLDISSTQIRANITQGLSTQGLLPDAVRDYIDHHQLYR